MGIIVASEDRDTSEVHCHVYQVTSDNAIVIHQMRYPNDFCINADSEGMAVGYPEPTVYEEPQR